MTGRPRPRPPLRTVLAALAWVLLWFVVGAGFDRLVLQ